MYKTILIPIDLAHAEHAKAGLKLADTIGEKDVRVVLANVIADVPAMVAAHLPPGTIEETRKRAHEELEAIARAAGRKPDVVVRTGNTRNGILDIAEEIDADLIIVASHKPGLQDYFLGSTAAGVVRHAKCSVHVTR